MWLWLFMSLAFIFNIVSWMVQVDKRKKTWTTNRLEDGQAYLAIVCFLVALISFIWHIASPNNLTASINIASNSLCALLFWSMLRSNRNIYKKEHKYSWCPRQAAQPANKSSQNLLRRFLFIKRRGRCESDLILLAKPEVINPLEKCLACPRWTKNQRLHWGSLE